MMKTLIACAVLGAVASNAAASDNHAAHQSNYAGQEARAIKSLSPDDIAELQRGGGWGVAKAAELNGVPGPAHVLEMKTAIDLSDSQALAITTIRDAMKSKAIEQGYALIALEADLERQFQDRTIDDEKLRSLLGEIAGVRAALRFTHLSAHLKLLPILSEEQVASYNSLRGYGDDPCETAPDGHDLENWRRHNGCG